MEASSEIELQVGAEHRLILDSPGGTGYVWEFETIGSPGVIRIRQEYNEPLPALHSSVLQTCSVQHAYIIEALAPGKAEVKFFFRRPWEKNIPPLQVKSVLVNAIK